MVTRLWLGWFALILAACSEPASAQRNDPVPPVAREFRGAWVATVDNIDWPSRPGLPTRDAKAELDSIVRRAVALQLNALVFQVRPAADAMYRSALEPWSEWLTGAQGKAPDEDWDPLAYMIERCHAEGLQLHAWFNPYRAAHPAGKSRPANNHIRKRQPSACVSYGKYVWMDPGEPRAADWSMKVILDVVRRYDLDGVHIDDYFYPYPIRDKNNKKVPFPDDASYERYRRGGGKLGRDDWRRHNIDTFVERFYREVHREKSWVQVGISPFGIARPGVPKGISAGIDQRDELYADVQRWMREGWYDYMTPQLYWPIAQKAQSFEVLLPWWIKQNRHGRHVWPGLFTSKALGKTKGWGRSELAEQIARIRAADDHPGHIHFSFKALRTDAPHVAGSLQEHCYQEAALPPPSAWLGVDAPSPPRARITREGDDRTVRWERSRDAFVVAIQVRSAHGWRTARILGAGARQFRLPRGYLEVAVTAVSRTGIRSPITRL